MIGPFSGREAVGSCLGACTGRWAADASMVSNFGNSRFSGSTSFSFTITSWDGAGGAVLCRVGKLYGAGAGASTATRGSAARTSGGTVWTALPFFRGALWASGAGASTFVPQTGQSGRPDDVHPVPHLMHFTIRGLLDPTEIDDPGVVGM